MGKLAHKTDLKPGAVSKEIFEREVLLCGKLSEKNDGKCSWGECGKCGVIPLLLKLYEGRLLEDSKDINETRNKYLSFSKSLNSSA